MKLEEGLILGNDFMLFLRKYIERGIEQGEEIEMEDLLSDLSIDDGILYYMPKYSLTIFATEDGVSRELEVAKFQKELRQYIRNKERERTTSTDTGFFRNKEALLRGFLKGEHPLGSLYGGRLFFKSNKLYFVKDTTMILIAVIEADLTNNMEVVEYPDYTNEEVKRSRIIDNTVSLLKQINKEIQ